MITLSPSPFGPWYRAHSPTDRVALVALGFYQVYPAQLPDAIAAAKAFGLTINVIDTKED